MLLAHLLQAQLLLGLSQPVLRLLRAPPLLREALLELSHLGRGGVGVRVAIGVAVGVGLGSSYGSA